jgi:NADPH:quinone reductase-like Zn-dependent oxidoreductase
MHAYVVPAGAKGFADLRRVERPDPEPGPGQVCIRVRAASLNYRDQAIAAGTYAGLGGTVNRDVTPLSDGAGEVIAVGEGVTQFRRGDRVAATFFQTPPQGPPFGARAALGSPLDGILSERIVLYEDGVVRIPQDLSFEEGACLPCAAVTAWRALMRAGRSIVAGDTVLVLGTGGVSIFALQFARAAGARVIATSSSDDKIERVKALGASEAVNYARTPEWEKEVLAITNGRGVDCVVEVGGAGTLNRSFHSLAPGGKVVLIGVLTGRDGEINPYALMGKNASLHGIFVGDREMFVEMNNAIEVNHLKPIIDKVFPFDDAVGAYHHHASGHFIGKVVIRVDPLRG